MKATAILSLLTLAASSLPAYSEVEDILQNTTAFKPKITVSDIYSEKVVVEHDEDTIFRSVEANPERLALSLTANLDGALTGPIDEDMSVGVMANNFSHSDVLGNAIDYKPGGKRATFAYTTEVDLPNGDTRTVRVGTIVYAWTTKILTVTLNLTDVAAAGESDIAASDYVDAPEAGEKLAIVDDPVAVTVDFGDVSGSRNIFLRGQARKVTKGFGPKTSDDYEEFDLADVNVQGAADVTGPVVKATFPAKPTALKTVDVAGTATDLQAVSLETVTVNGVDAADAVVTLNDPDEAGVYAWSVTGIALKKGPNSVVVTFSDEDGNLTKVTKSYSVK